MPKPHDDSAETPHTDSGHSEQDLNQEKPWYHAGLRFECTQCGDCCSGDPGFVWLSTGEIDAISDHLQIKSRNQFIDRFARKKGARISLQERDNGDCIFLDPTNRRCQIYEVRPIQCKTWPFWQSNLETEKDWEDTCRECPGAGKGQLYSLETISHRREQRIV